MRTRFTLTTAILIVLGAGFGCGGGEPATPTPSPTAVPTVARPIATPTPTETFYKVSGTGGLGLIIREKPDRTSAVVALACEGAVLQTEGQPVEGGEYRWLPVRGLGYAADAFLTPSEGPATALKDGEGGIKRICPN